jgi:hypothetical protein
MEYACRKNTECKKAFPTKQARALHELVHRDQPRRPCPDCGKIVAEQHMARHQRTHGGSGRRVVKKAKPEKRSATRRTIGAILEELYEAVAFFEAEMDAMRKQLAHNEETMAAVQEAYNQTAMLRKPQVPRR